MYARTLICLLAAIIALTYGNRETELVRNLFRSYDETERVTRGVRHEADKMNTTFGMSIINVLDLDTVNGIATINTWYRQMWLDTRLTWNPEEYNGIRAIRIPNQSVWKPDIVPYTSVGSSEEMLIKDDAMVVLYNTGNVLWIPRFTVKAACRRVTSPEQAWNCSLKYGSWTFDGNQLDIDFYEGKTSIDLSDVTVLENGYKVTAQQAERRVKYYPCCTEPYIDLYFPFQISM